MLKMIVIHPHEKHAAPFLPQSGDGLINNCRNTATQYGAASNDNFCVQFYRPLLFSGLFFYSFVLRKTKLVHLFSNKQAGRTKTTLKPRSPGRSRKVPEGFPEDFPEGYLSQPGAKRVKANPQYIYQYIFIYNMHIYIYTYIYIYIYIYQCTWNWQAW